MAALTQGDLHVQAAVPVMEIRQFHMKVQANAHPAFYLEGMLSEEAGEEGIRIPLSGTTVRIGAGDRLLFTGILEEAEVVQEGRGYEIIMRGAAATRLLDCRKKARSFQDVSMTYRQVMEQVLADTPGAGLDLHVEDRVIGRPLYQLEETDWGFLKRLAGHLGTAIMPSVYPVAAQIHVGQPAGRSITAGTGTEKERSWYDRDAGGLCISVRTWEDWEPGDEVCLEGRVLSVKTKECRLEKGLLQFYYTLSDQPGLYADRYDDPYVTGLLLPATVLDTQAEQVRVRFDMDREQDPGYAFWYPWRPDMGNLTYCMPEKGERVYVLLGTAPWEEDRAVCGVRKNGEGNGELDPACRYLTTKEGKRLFLTPEKAGFQDLQRPLRFGLLDATGAEAVSHRKLTLRAKEGIGFKAGRILIKAPQEISLVKKGASPTVINMCNGFDTIGVSDRVMMQGTGADAFPAARRQDGQGAASYAFDDPEQIRGALIASTPAVEPEDGLDRVLEGCRVRELGDLVRDTV